MNQDIKKILEELYALDNKLRQREPELVKALELLLAVRPEVKVDQAFARQLRTQLLKRAREAQTQGGTKAGLSNIINLTLMNKLVFAVGGAALALIIAIPLLTYKGGRQIINTGSPVEFQSGIEKLGDMAFGSLSGAFSGAADSATGLGSANLDESAPAAEPTPAAGVPTMAKGLGGGGGGGIAEADRMIYPAPIFYEYVYEGDELELNNDKLAVFKRVKNNQVGSSLAQVLGNFSQDLLNLSKFGNKYVENINISEDKPFGYTVFYNFYDGLVSINQNWRRWPVVDYTQRLSMNDIPADSELISIADNFLREYNIPTENYAQPEVRKDWLPYYESLADKSEFYVEEIQVIYPEMVDGQVIYDQSGMMTGLTVSISLRHKRVSNVWNLTTQFYQSSDYQAVTDVQKILDVARNGGGMYPFYRMDGAEIKQVTLGTPSRELVKFYNYVNNENQELLAPALVFPITGGLESSDYYRQNIVVPLVLDLLPDVQSTPEPMPIQIMEKNQ